MTETPNLIKILFKSYVWEINTQQKQIYLTFDDGPIPEVTQFVLEQLAAFEAKATFFCVGQNVINFPEIFQQIVQQGHKIGNHTLSHINGWKSENGIYQKDFEACQMAIINQNVQTNLFRPPYGKIKKIQAAKILKTHKIIMWSVLTRDYDQNLDENKCLLNTIKATKNGSIVLFHDSIKAQKNLYYALPKFLSHFKKLGFDFLTL